MFFLWLIYSNLNVDATQYVVLLRIIGIVGMQKREPNDSLFKDIISGMIHQSFQCSSITF